MPTEEQLQGGFNLGEWQVLPGRRELHRGDEVKRPEPKQFDVLMALAKRDTNLVTKQELIDEVWGGRPTADEPITRCVSQLRAHLDDRKKPHVLIETLQRLGYRLKQRVELHNPPLPEVTLPSVAESGPSLRLWRLVAAVLAIGFIGIIVYVRIIDPPPPPPPERSIAVLPFENLSGQQADEYMADGFKVALVQALHGMEDYNVKNVRQNYTEEPEEIARQLGVAKILMGSMQRDGNLLRFSYEISKSGQVAFTDNVDGTADDLFALQQELARAVIGDLGDNFLPDLIKSHRPNSAAYDSYMRGIVALDHRGDPGNLENAIELFENAIRLDEKYGPSYLGLATVYPLLPNYRGAPTEEMDRLALETIEKGIAVDPTIEDAAGAIYGYVYHKRKRWEESETAFLRAVNAEVVDPNAFNWYSRMLASVGRLDASLTQSLAGLEIDPSSTYLNSRVAMSYAWLGQNQKALEYYERAKTLGWSGSIDSLGYAFILIQTGQIGKAKNLAMGTVQAMGASTDWVEPVFDAFGDPGNPIKSEAGLEALNAVSAVQPVYPIIELTVRAILGDLDGAMRIAEMLEEPGEAFQMDMLFIPELKDLRRHPDFMPLMDRLGITRYWQGKGCVWNGDRVSCQAD